MASRKANKLVEDWLAAMGCAAVTESVFADMVRALPAVKEAALRHAVRESGLPMAALVEGVRQGSLEELARTLCALQVEYQAASTEQDQERMRRIRALVIESKTHARFAARLKQDKREIVEWMLVWLQNPGLFDTWVRLRLRSIVVEREDLG